MGREALATAIKTSLKVVTEDEAKRDEWLRTGLRSPYILVGEKVTLADVHRWLRCAVNGSKS